MGMLRLKRGCPFFCAVHFAAKKYSAQRLRQKNIEVNSQLNQTRGGIKPGFKTKVADIMPATLLFFETNFYLLITNFFTAVLSPIFNSIR